MGRETSLRNVVGCPSLTLACRRPPIAYTPASLRLSVKKQRAQILPGFLKEQAFELNIITLYAMQVLGATHAVLEATVREKAPKPVAVPIRNVLILAAEPIPAVQSFDLGEVPEDGGQEEYH